jgi:hypothetical protein
MLTALPACAWLFFIGYDLQRSTARASTCREC